MKFKIKKYKFIFIPDRNHLPQDDIYVFANKSSDELCNLSKRKISYLFAPHMDPGDKRLYSLTAKFSEAEASQLLLKFLEERFKDSQNEKRRLKTWNGESLTVYSRLRGWHRHDRQTIIDTVNQEYDQAHRRVKIWRKKVEEILKSPEYMWELLSQ